MHKHVEWDDPGRYSVKTFFASDPDDYPAAYPGRIICGHYRGITVRVRVEAYVGDDTSIGEVVALIDPQTGERLQEHDKLALGDMVRLPDAMRAIESHLPDEEDAD